MGSVSFNDFAAPAPVSGAAAALPSRLERFKRASITFAETFKLALDALRAHKLRSFLTLLGVILAVTTLVFVMSVIAGLNMYVAERVANLGANVFLVDRLGIITSRDQFLKAQKRPMITFDDYARLRDNMRLAKAVAAEEDRNVQTRRGDAIMENTMIMGATPNFAEVRNLNVASGRFITEADDEHRSEVVFIGPDLAQKFFPNSDPIGKTIRAEAHSYEVIGVAEPIGSAFGQSQDNYMLMRAWRHLDYKAPDNFAILGSDSIMALWHELTGNLAFVALALVSVFLVVGGIVIMNIMLASVTERTREIGLRRSLGARKKHILLQFLTESGVLAATGGLVGIATAYLAVTLVKAAFSFPMETPVSAVILSLGISTAVGLFFGIFPAMRAAKLDPIEALRADA